MSFTLGRLVLSATLVIYGLQILTNPFIQVDFQRGLKSNVNAYEQIHCLKPYLVHNNTIRIVIGGILSLSGFLVFVNSQLIIALDIIALIIHHLIIYNPLLASNQEKMQACLISLLKVAVIIGGLLVLSARFSALKQTTQRKDKQKTD